MPRAFIGSKFQLLTHLHRSRRFNLGKGIKDWEEASACTCGLTRPQSTSFNGNNAPQADFSRYFRKHTVLYLVYSLKHSYSPMLRKFQGTNWFRVTRVYHRQFPNSIGKLVLRFIDRNTQYYLLD